MIKPLTKLALPVFSSLLLTGCATIVSDSTYPVLIDSWPKHAEFSVVDENGLEVGHGFTPNQVILKADDGYFDAQSYRISYRAPGYFDKTVNMYANVDGWYWGNLVFGGLIGFLVLDPVTGSMWKLPPSVGASLDEDGADAAYPRSRPGRYGDAGEQWEMDEYICKPATEASAPRYSKRRPTPKRFIISHE